MSRGCADVLPENRSAATSCSRREKPRRFVGPPGLYVCLRLNALNSIPSNLLNHHFPLDSNNCSNSFAAGATVFGSGSAEAGIHRLHCLVHRRVRETAVYVGGDLVRTVHTQRRPLLLRDRPKRNRLPANRQCHNQAGPLNHLRIECYHADYHTCRAG